jgi:hypothetical protein
VSRAREVAGDDLLDAFIGERRGRARRLAPAARAERGVELALHAHLGVPDRLPVADGDDAGDPRVGRAARHAHRRSRRFSV